jgi:thioredoxin-related protein
MTFQVHVKAVVLLSMLLVALEASATAPAEEPAELYDPAADVEKDVAALLEKTKASKKHIMLQIGGNWCGWCHRFHGFVNEDEELKASLNKNFEVYHLNFSEENQNLAYLKKLRFPQRFGFPVIVILDGEGNRLHTQDSALLEEGKTYNKDKVKTFFENWSPGALDEAKYKEE